jgi:hypothetical protein
MKNIQLGNDKVELTFDKLFNDKKIHIKDENGNTQHISVTDAGKDTNGYTFEYNGKVYLIGADNVKGQWHVGEVKQENSEELFKSISGKDKFLEGTSAKQNAAETHDVAAQNNYNNFLEQLEKNPSYNFKPVIIQVKPDIPTQPPTAETLVATEEATPPAVPEEEPALSAVPDSVQAQQVPEAQAETPPTAGTADSTTIEQNSPVQTAAEPEAETSATAEIETVRLPPLPPGTSPRAEVPKSAGKEIPEDVIIGEIDIAEETSTAEIERLRLPPLPPGTSPMVEVPKSAEEEIPEDVVGGETRSEAIAEETISTASNRAALEADGWEFVKGADGKPDMMFKTTKNENFTTSEAVFDTNGDGSFGKGDQFVVKQESNKYVASSTYTGTFSEDPFINPQSSPPAATERPSVAPPQVNQTVYDDRRETRVNLTREQINADPQLKKIYDDAYRKETSSGNRRRVSNALTTAYNTVCDYLKQNASGA